MRSSRRRRHPLSIGCLGAGVEQSRLAYVNINMGTLKGFPCPPAMVRGERSSPAPHAINRRKTLPKQNPAPAAKRAGHLLGQGLEIFAGARQIAIHARLERLLDR